MKLLSLILSIVMVSNVAFADCQFTNLVHNTDGTVTYSKADHVCVGQIVQDDATKTQQVQDLSKAITLKDLAITKSDERAKNWMDTSLKLEDNIQKIHSVQKQEEWIWFVLGAITVIGTGFALSSVTNRH